MLYIETKTCEEGQWYVGNSFPLDPRDVTMIQADGDELDLINSIFPSGIPKSSDRIIRFYGNIAKTIAWSLAIRGLRKNGSS